MSGQIDERPPSGTYNYLFDGNGSVVGLTDSSDHLVNQYSYDPYGNTTSSSGSALDYFGFQGSFRAPASLTHVGDRYENPADARWTQQDPLQNINSLTQSNRYAFAADDPINNGDPTGKDIFSDIAKAGDTIANGAESLGLIGAGVGLAVGCSGLSGGTATPACVVAGGEIAAAGLIGGYATYREATG